MESGIATPSITHKKDRGVSKMETPSGTQQMTIINESGLYLLSSYYCRSVSLSSVRTASDPHPVLWTLNHLYRLEAILTDPVEKLSSDADRGF